MVLSLMFKRLLTDHTGSFLSLACVYTVFYRDYAMSEITPTPAFEWKFLPFFLFVHFVVCMFNHTSVYVSRGINNSRSPVIIEQYAYLTGHLTTCSVIVSKSFVEHFGSFSETSTGRQYD